MTKSVKDCSIMLEAMAGFDKKDSTSIEKKKENYSKNLKTDIKGLKKLEYQKNIELKICQKKLMNYGIREKVF